MSSKTLTAVSVVAVALMMNMSPAQAIVGGGLASPGEYPWMAAIYNDDPSYGQFCGGTLVDADTVVTAAHCVEGLLGIKFIDNLVDRLLYGELMVMLGRESLSGSGGEEIAVSNVVVHPNYRGGGSDIAIIKLASNSAQTPIAYAVPADASYYSTGTTATVTGWGTTSSGGSSSNNLREVDVPIVSDTSCQSSYGSSLEPSVEICAGYPNGGKDSCQGDSGGPLIVSKGSGKLLVGVVSWGNGCARAGYPGVYAEVGALSSFITANL